MKNPPKIVVIDRSELAANLYRVIFGPITSSVLVIKNILDAKTVLHGRDNVAVTIINSNILNKKTLANMKTIFRNRWFLLSKKILLQGRQPTEFGLSEELAKLYEFTLFEKPFFPEQLLAHIKKNIQI